MYDNIHYAPVEPHALAVGDDGQPNLPQHGGDLPVLGQPAPACHRADLRTNQGSVLRSGDQSEVSVRSRDQWPAYLAHEVAVRVGEADGDDVGLELDAGLHLQQRDVVLVRELVEVAVRHNLLHPSGKKYFD